MKLPVLDQGAHIIGYEPIIKTGHEGLLHHIFVVCTCTKSRKSHLQLRSMGVHTLQKDFFNNIKMLDVNVIPQTCRHQFGHV